MTTIEPGRIAYEARFAGEKMGPRGTVGAWEDLPEDARAIWRRIEGAVLAGVPVLANDAELEANPFLHIRHLEQQCCDFIRERDEWKAVADATRAECDAFKREVERLISLLLPIQEYAKVALRPEIDIGEGEIGETIHDGLRHSIRTQDLRAIRDADLSRAALAQEKVAAP